MSPTFFIDRNLGRLIFPDLLQKAGIAIECHHDHFDDTCPDEEWIPIVASKGWYALSRDVRIYRNPTQRKVVIGSGLGLFVIRGGERTSAELGANFVLSYPAILKFIETYKPPFIASIRRPSGRDAVGKVVKME